jgi:hypothetical protein
VLKIGRFAFGKGAARSTFGKAQRHRPRKSARLLKTQGRTIPWAHAAIYAGVVLAIAVAVGLWQHSFDVQQAALDAPLPPPTPQVAAQRLVELGVVGPGNVSNVTWDAKTAALEMTVRDVLIKPGQSVAEQRKNVQAEGELAVHAIQGGFAGNKLAPPKAITIHLTSGTTLVATTSVAPGQTAPTTVFAGTLR